MNVGKAVRDETPITKEEVESVKNSIHLLDTVMVKQTQGSEAGNYKKGIVIEKYKTFALVRVKMDSGYLYNEILRYVDEAVRRRKQSV